jgi:predicted dehydrogenase
VDAVVIATPPSQHVEPARAALRAGKHCWVEKPLALRVADAAELVALARERRRTLFVDETFLYDPLIQRAREWIAAGRLGRLHHLSFERLGLGRVRRDSDVWWNSGAHDLALLRYLVPAPVEDIHLERFAFLQPDIADACVATARLAGGVVAEIHLSWLSPVRSARLVAVGSAGMLTYEGRFGQRALSFFDYRFADGANAQSTVMPVAHFAASETHSGGPEEPLALAARAFLDAIRTGEPAPSDGALALEVVKLLAAGESASAIR